jgi:AcrR family transcriptional regulator
MDLRVKKTRLALREALWEIIRRDGLEHTTVSAVCERALVNRATFYRHYEGLQDLLERGIDEFLDEIYAQTVPVSAALEEYATGKLPHNIVTLFEFINKRAEFFKIALAENGIPSMADRIRAYLIDVFKERVRIVLQDKEPTIEPVLPFSLIALSMAYTVIGVLTWWLRRDCDPPVDIMAQLTLTMFAVDTYRLTGYRPVQLPDGLVESLRERTAHMEPVTSFL